jgi:hypothetical protein
MKQAIEIDSNGMIYIPSFMTIGSGIRVILRALPLNLKSFCVGITDERDLWCTPLRWLHVT